MFLKNKIRAVTYVSIKKTQKNSEKISRRFREKFPGISRKFSSEISRNFLEFAFFKSQN